MAALEFWFEFASTYSYPAAERIVPLAAARGVDLVWRPFLLGPIFAAQGWTDSPFNLYPAKGAYMWRDLERTCAARGIGWKMPSAFPRNGLTGARVALAAAQQPWIADFVRAVYRANFVEDREIGWEEVIAEILASVGQDADVWVERASAPENKSGLREQTSQAQERGIFGAPSFTVGDELFWGDDRLEAALLHASGGS